MATTVTLALTAITAITIVESLFVFELPEAFTLKVLDDPLTFCVTTVEATVLAVVVVVVAVGLTAEELIELVGKIVFCGTKEETELGLS